MSNLQRLIREVTHLSFSNSNFSLLLRIDHFGSFGEGINIFLKENRYTGEIYSDREVFLDKLQTTFFSSYLLEMYVVYANGNKELYIDTLYWMTKQLRDVHFKQRFSGPLFERYVRELASKYDSQHSLNAKIYGDDTYYISKGKEKRVFLV